MDSSGVHKKRSLKTSTAEGQTSPRQRRDLKTSIDGYNGYELVCQYCITFATSDTPMVLTVMQNNPKFSQFDNKYVMCTKTTKIVLTENSDSTPTRGILFIAALTLRTQPCISSTLAQLSFEPEKLLELQNEYASDIKILKELHTELLHSIKAEIGWKFLVCKWEIKK